MNPLNSIQKWQKLWEKLCLNSSVQHFLPSSKDTMAEIKKENRENKAAYTYFIPKQWVVLVWITKLHLSKANREE